MELVDRRRHIDTAAAISRRFQGGCLEGGANWKALARSYVGFRGSTFFQVHDTLPTLVFT